jgi:hypothetical protein
MRLRLDRLYFADCGDHPYRLTGVEDTGTREQQASNQVHYARMALPLVGKRIVYLVEPPVSHNNDYSPYRRKPKPPESRVTCKASVVLHDSTYLLRQSGLPILYFSGSLDEARDYMLGLADGFTIKGVLGKIFHKPNAWGKESLINLFVNEHGPAPLLPKDQIK